MNNCHKPLDMPVVAHSVSSWLPITMTWVYSQLKYTNDFSSIVLAQTTQNRDRFSWEPIYSVSTKLSLFFFRVLKKLKIRDYPSVYDSAISMHRPVILHSHFGDRGWSDLAIAQKHALKHVVTFYGHDVNMLPTQEPIWRERYKELFEKADLFLCEGPHMAKCIVNLGCRQEKVKVQRLGIEVDNIPFVPRKIGDDGLIKILIAGTFREKKGIPFALEAIGLLMGKYQNLRVTIIGDSTGYEREESEKKKIGDVIERYSLAPITRMLGFQPHNVLFEEAFQHHIFLSPSVTSEDGDTEGGAPVTIIEMIATGMPVVSTFHCDIPQIIEHGVNGLLAEERDVEGLAAHMCWLVEHAEDWEKFATAGRERVQRGFCVRAQAYSLSNIYRELCEAG